jgi:hypothetical protein
MRMVSRQFVGASPQDRADERTRLLELEQRLTPWCARERFGFRARVLRSADDALDQTLEPDELLAAAGAFPILWLNVSYAEGALSDEELVRLEHDARLIRIV